MKPSCIGFLTAGWSGPTNHLLINLVFGHDQNLLLVITGLYGAISVLCLAGFASDDDISFGLGVQCEKGVGNGQTSLEAYTQSATGHKSGNIASETYSYLVVHGQLSHKGKVLDRNQVSKTSCTETRKAMSAQCFNYSPPVRTICRWTDCLFRSCRSDCVCCTYDCR